MLTVVQFTVKYLFRLQTDCKLISQRSSMILYTVEYRYNMNRYTVISVITHGTRFFNDKFANESLKQNFPWCLLTKSSLT